MWGLRKSVRKKLRWGLIIVAVQLVLLCLCGSTTKRITVKKYEEKLEEKTQLLEAAERLAYITTEPVRAGELFTEENVERRYVLSEQAADTLTTDPIGSVACVDLPVGLILNTSVCSSEQYDTTDRRCTFQGILFSECFDTYDKVDVRIRYGNGENYCVLKKKRLLPTGQAGSCCFILNESEQLMMSGAKLDTEIYDGAEIYLVGVPNEWEKEEVLSMFLPAEQVVLQLGELGEDNDFLTARGIEQRKALEGRLAQHIKKIKDGVF